MHIKKILLLVFFVFLFGKAHAVNTENTPLVAGALINSYIQDEAGLGETITSETVAGRYPFERALLDRNIT